MDTGLTNHPESLALLRAILDAPAEDAPRLVYADWLEEHGEAGRAEFIRLQVKLSIPCHWCDGYGTTLGHGPDRGNPPCGHCDTTNLRRREDELLTDDTRIAWFAVSGVNVQSGDDPQVVSWWVPPSGPSITATARRGFVAEVTCAAADWRDHGPTVVAAHPVERVTMGRMVLEIEPDMPYRLWVLRLNIQQGRERYQDSRLFETRQIMIDHMGYWLGMAIERLDRAVAERL